MFFTLSNGQDISAMKRATGDPLVSKRLDFRGLFGYFKKLKFRICGFVDFWIFEIRFLHHLTRKISRQRKELPEIRWCQNDRIFEGFLDFPKKIRFGFLDFLIFGFLDFLDF